MLVIKVEQEREFADQKKRETVQALRSAQLCCVQFLDYLGIILDMTGHCSFTAKTSSGADTAPQVGTSSLPALLSWSGGERTRTS